MAMGNERVAVSMRLVASSPRHTVHSSLPRAYGPMQNLKGQVSMELLVTFGIFLAFSVPVLLVMFSTSNYGYERSSLAQADAASKTIADTINEVYLQGAGARRSIAITFPSNMEQLVIANNEVVVRLRTSNGVYEAVSPVFGKVDPLPPNARIGLGLTVLRLEAITDTNGLRVHISG